MLDTRQTTVDTSCITTKETELDSAFITQLVNQYVANGNGNWTARTCVFRYANAQSNTTHFFDGIDLASMAMGANASNTSVPVAATTVATPTVATGARHHRRAVPSASRLSDAAILEHALPALIRENAHKFDAVVKRYTDK